MDLVSSLSAEVLIGIIAAAFLGLSGATLRWMRRRNGPNTVTVKRNGTGVAGFRIRDPKTNAMWPLSDLAGQTVAPKVCPTKLWVEVLNARDHVILQGIELDFSRTHHQEIELP